MMKLALLALLFTSMVTNAHAEYHRSQKAKTILNQHILARRLAEIRAPAQVTS